MMSSDVLRQAAALMRENAIAATPGPWGRSWDNQMIAEYGSPCDGEQLADFFDSESNAVHAASWHPAVAFAVADWLDVVAERWDTPARPTLPQRHAALAVATVYLADTAP